jgi:uncharacterized membrane protein
MESRSKVLGHAAHPMLVMFPLGALGFSVASDALHRRLGQPRYGDAARLALDFSLATAVLAAPFGTIDWLSIRVAPRARLATGYPRARARTKARRRAARTSRSNA